MTKVKNQTFSGFFCWYLPLPSIDRSWDVWHTTDFRNFLKSTFQKCIYVYIVYVYTYIYTTSQLVYSKCAQNVLSVLPQNQWSAIHRAGSQAEEQLRRLATEKQIQKSTNMWEQTKTKNVRANKNKKIWEQTKTNMRGNIEQIWKQVGGQLSEKEGHKSTNPQNVHLRKSTKYTFTVKVLLIHKMHVRESTKVHKVWIL